jgi:hypothetical protein
VVVTGKDAATSSPRADRTTSAIDHLPLVSLPGHPHAVPNPFLEAPALGMGSVFQRAEQGEPLRQVAHDYSVSFVAVQRVLRAARRGSVRTEITEKLLGRMECSPSHSLTYEAACINVCRAARRWRKA